MALNIRPSVSFEVEKIIAVSGGNGNVNNYQVQWAPTWISALNLVGCEHLIDEFLQQHAKASEQQPLPPSEEFLQQQHLNKLNKNNSYPSEKPENTDRCDTLKNSTADLYEQRNNNRSTPEAQNKKLSIARVYDQLRASVAAADRRRVKEEEQNDYDNFSAESSGVTNSNTVDVEVLSSDSTENSNMEDLNESTVNPNFEWAKPLNCDRMAADISHSSAFNEYKFNNIVSNNCPVPVDDAGVNFNLLEPDKKCAGDIGIVSPKNEPVKGEERSTYDEDLREETYCSRKSNHLPDSYNRPSEDRKQSSAAIPHEMYKLQRVSLHRCGECDHSFATKRDLERHVRVHTGEKPFHCNGCDKSFARKDTLAKHKKVFNFVCVECEKHFSQEGSLTWHMLNDHSIHSVT